MSLDLRTVLIIGVCSLWAGTTTTIAQTPAQQPDQAAAP